MWLATGPFDVEPNDASFIPDRTKVLRTGTGHLLSRDGPFFFVKYKTISHKNHCSFDMKPFAAEDVANPDMVPTLTLINHRKKGMRITRMDGSDIMVNPQQSIDLEDGDQIYIVTAVKVTITWVEVCCYSPRDKSPASVDGCASLGIHLVTSPHKKVTHHLTSSLVATPSSAASLLNAATFVKPEWLNELIKTAQNIPTTFSMPATSGKYRPSFSPALTEEQKHFSVWEANEERLTMFRGLRFLCIGEKFKEISTEMQTVLKRGGGKVDMFDIQDGKGKLRTFVTRNKGNWVAIADSRAMMAAVGNDEWEDIVKEGHKLDLSFVNIDDIIKAIMNVDIAPLTEQTPPTMQAGSPDRSSPLPEVVPNTYPDEPSYPPDSLPLGRGKKRAAPRQPSAEPQATQQDDEPIPKRRMIRRLGPDGKPMITGLQDNSTLLTLQEIKELAAREGEASGETRPAPLAKKPTRRAGTQKKVVALFSDSEDETAAPSKQSGTAKYKDLYEAETLATNELLAGSSLSQTQTQTLTGSSRSGPTVPAARPLEEEEETQPLRTQAGSKRKASQVLFDDSDAEMGAPPAEKRRAIEEINAVQPSADPPTSTDKPASKAPASMASRPPASKSKQALPKTPSKRGAEPGRPDTDQAFLKAIASTRKGKRTEDDFDRDFNKLRIAIPEGTTGDAEEEEPEKQWAILEDFGDTRGLTGNFMTILEMPVYRKPQSEIVANPAWEGKLNFKKFKKKTKDNSLSRPLVKLIPCTNNGDEFKQKKDHRKLGHEESDMSLFDDIKERPNSPPARVLKASAFDEDSDTPPPRVRSTQRRARSVVKEDHGNDSDEIPIVPSRSTRATNSRASSRAGSSQPQSQTRRGKKQQALFLDSDIEEQDEIRAPSTYKDEDEEMPADSQSMTSTIATIPPPKIIGRKRGAASMDVEEDEDAVFGGTKRRTRARK